MSTTTKAALCCNLQSIPVELQYTQLPCSVLPSQRAAAAAYLAAHPTNMFVSKALASASARSHAIRRGSETVEFVSSYDGQETVLQQYFSHPALDTDGHKCDLCVYLLVRTDPLRLWIHNDGWLWVAQLLWDVESASPHVHFTNAEGYPTEPPTAEMIRLRRGRRKSLLQYKQRFTEAEWATLWSAITLSLRTAVLSFAHRYSCHSSPHQSDPVRCGRCMNLLAVDLAHSEDLTKAYVLDINNNPGLHAYGALQEGEENDVWQASMYRAVYGGMLRLLGFGPGGYVDGGFAGELARYREGGYRLLWPPPTEAELRTQHAWFLPRVAPQDLEVYRGTLWVATEDNGYTECRRDPSLQ